MEGLASIIALLILSGAYFMPSLIAHERNRSNLLAIVALNFFLGWTLVGWVVALVWALSKDKFGQPATG